MAAVTGDNSVPAPFAADLKLLYKTTSVEELCRHVARHLSVVN